MVIRRVYRGGGKGRHSGDAESVVTPFMEPVVAEFTLLILSYTGTNSSKLDHYKYTLIYVVAEFTLLILFDNIIVVLYSCKGPLL